MQASPPLTRRFTAQDVSLWFGEPVVAKAADYVQHVRQLHVGATDITALVPGSAPRPYAVRIAMKADGKKQISAQCSCPVANLCKHGAAVLLAAIAQRDAARTEIDPAVLDWVKSLRTAVRQPQPTKSPQREQLFYVLEFAPQKGQVEVRILKGRAAANDALPTRAEPWYNLERALLQPPGFVTDDDLAILRLLWLARDRDAYLMSFYLRGRSVSELMPRLLGTGRCYFADATERPLTSGANLTGQLEWHRDDDGLLHVRGRVPTQPEALVLPTEPPWYVDPATRQCGPLEMGASPALISNVLAAPALNAASAAVVARELAELLPDLPRPDPGIGIKLRRIETRPRPVLQLFSQVLALRRPWRGYGAHFQLWMDLGRVLFDYGGVEVAPDDERDYRTQGGETVYLVRDAAAEARALSQLAQFGFEELPGEVLHAWHDPIGRHCYAMADESGWEDWQSDKARALRALGWATRQEASFRHNQIDIDALYADIEEGEPGWFDVELGFELEGERIALAPLLAEFLRQRPQLASGAGLAQLPDKTLLEFDLEDGQRVRIGAARIKPLLRTLMDLFEGHGSGKLRVSRLDAPRLQGLGEVADTRGLQAVEAAVASLQGAGGVSPVAAPAGLGVALRPYQLEGLAWLQHLRAHALGGILADDMGLGKTAQALAHLLIEKQAGRLDRPCLVVLPTSLVFNWKREAARIAPALSVLALHGPQRDFARIGEHDIVLTTYPLVWRDAKALQAHEFHYLILDEAQTVKNAASKAASVVRELKARHRLCLTGTPMENHLGELWAQFDFLLPGFLGDSKDFAQRWRKPIEKGGDALRRELLARRVKPFILRRRKEDVARELPPKNIVIRTVELTGGQRDLYETVRSAMDDKVRDEVAARGFARSQIVILDALLKLRQVCCDPRLLSIPSAAMVKERAKLQLLMEMLPELVDEGRCVLVFSQFTGMLRLIAEALVAAKIPHVMLTGDTHDRERVVEQFQEGDVPVFLISLKAGGVGLNLTRADTVIHYDPWWNPAAEDQATDRAHRIGQTKSIFVYKLIVAGSIEERILGLQEKKAALANAVLGGDVQGDTKFSEDDLANLFAPLPEMPEAAATKKPRRSAES